MRILGILLAVFITTFTFAQVKIPANSKADIQLIIENAKLNNGIPTKVMMDRFAINYINSEYYVSFIAKTASNFDAYELQSLGIISGKPINSIVSLKIPVFSLGEINTLFGIEVLQLAGKIKPDLDRAVKDVRADSVHLGLNLPQSYTGKNVLIGITDWGFDYTSPMFYDTLLSQTRILAAWDQYRTGLPPAGFDYGSEFSNPTDLYNIGSDTSNIYSYGTHGTHVAGIAGGSGAGTNYRGLAFEANYLFATFLVDEASVLDAWEWMYQKSVTEGKRLVINMSWGLYHLGTLDGNSLLSQAIDAYADQGVVFSNSGGNNGNVNFHIKKQFSNDEIVSKIEFYDYSANPNMWGQSIHMWGESGSPFEAAIKVVNAGGSIIESPYFSTATTTDYIDTFVVLGLDTVWYNLSVDAAHPLNGRPQMRLRVKNTNTTLRVLLKSRAIAGKVHYWNVTELSNNVGNWGMPFSTNGAGTIAGDNLYGISEPSCSNSLISVAAYAAQYSTGGTSMAGGNIASFSSYGPRYDEVLKPDIAAPGSSVASSISSFTDAAYTSVGSVVFGSETYHFARFSGTSMSSPVVAGVCALILEANPYLSAQQVKDIIIETARTDNFTGVIPVNGSTRWGWGKLNAYDAVKLALITVGTEVMENEIPWTLYPNPVNESIHFTLVEELPKMVKLIDSAGKVTEKPILDGVVYVKELLPGKYWLSMVINGRVTQQSFIKL
jgi:subtilisin family serine protease